MIKIEDAIANLKNQIMRFEKGTEPNLALQMAIKALEQEPCADAVRRLIKDKINTLEDIASTANSEGRWVEDEKCCYTIEVLEELIADLEELSPVTPQEHILDKIRAEIEQEPYVSKMEVLEIIDKYKAESEEGAKNGQV